MKRLLEVRSSSAELPYFKRLAERLRVIGGKLLDTVSSRLSGCEPTEDVSFPPLAYRGN